MFQPEVVLVLHNIRSALNVGSIFRTADAVGVSKIYLGGYTPIPYIEGNPSSLRSSGSSSKLSKTALGAEKNIPWEHINQTWRILEQLKKERNTIIALEQSKNSIDYRKFQPKFPLVLVVGNEIKGLSRQILKYCDTTIELPMRGKKESLNVAVAVGVALYKITEKNALDSA